MPHVTRPSSDPRRGRPVTGPAPAGRDHFVTAGDLRFHYREWGRPEWPPVALLHGVVGNSWEWITVARRLAAHRYRVLAFDQRGHGASEWAAEYSAAAMSADIPSLLDAVRVPRTVLVGHSLGGIHAFHAAAAFPDRVSALVLVDVAPGPVSDPAAMAGVVSWIRGLGAAEYPGPAAAFAQWKAMNPRARDAELREYIDHNLRRLPSGRWKWRFDAAGLASYLSRPDAPGMWAALRAVACPALLIRGAESELISPGAAREAVDALPDGRLAEIPRGGHDLTVEQPEAVADRILAFLRTV
ncbi:alpha/beta fold hydrolase [Streptomyces sp. YIM 98790]|uniref:alpha/beta fold hydrolase n=1 Tax=Streptomyces sp. YIM 98790 TaxID=2689077 RepID=UPI00140E53E9|nr:alpha/beta hydrolase [Streptomyces sp. YIM 98790]